MRVTAAAILLAAASPGVAGPVDTILAEAAASCTSFENGVFDPRDAVTQVELSGAAPSETIVDESRFACSSAASMYCGSGGCMLHVVDGDTVATFQSEGWRVIDWDGRPILLISRDGGWCGGIGAQSCVEAVTWSLGEMLTVMPQTGN